MEEHSRSIQVAVLTEAPPEKVAKNLLDKLFSDVELQDLTWLSCAARVRTREGGRPQRPLPIDTEKHRPELKRQLALAKPDWLVLVGELPLHLFRPDLNVSSMHGRPFLLGKSYGFCIYNPVAALRNPVWIQDMRADLELLAILTKRASVWTSVSNTCVVCGETPHVENWDNQGVPYCENHWKG